MQPVDDGQPHGFRRVDDLLDRGREQPFTVAVQPLAIGRRINLITQKHHHSAACANKAHQGLDRRFAEAVYVGENDGMKRGEA